MLKSRARRTLAVCIKREFFGKSVFWTDTSLKIDIKSTERCTELVCTSIDSQINLPPFELVKKCIWGAYASFVWAQSTNLSDGVRGQRRRGELKNTKSCTAYPVDKINKILSPLISQRLQKSRRKKLQFFKKNFFLQTMIFS
jgi:hypothetical protein